VNTDTFFTQGYSHHVCQDFALSNNRDEDHKIIGPPLVLVSDGCSSAPMTDIGSRLMCLTARKHLQNIETQSIKTVLYGISSELEMLCNTLSLDKQCLYATLLAAWRDPSSTAFRVLVIGDGAIIATRRDGTINTTEIHFPSGAPYYLRYEGDRSSKENYFASFGDKLEIRTVNLRETVFNTETTRYLLDRVNPYFIYDFPIEEYESVAIVTDGLFDLTRTVTTETSKSEVRIDPEEVIEQLVAFKGHCKGEFVKRRCEMAFKKFALEQIRSRDDFAMGVITARDDAAEEILGSKQMLKLLENHQK
jgi:serine/threonine protein phosphatase PrpC